MTFVEQVQFLRLKGLVIDDEDLVVSVLQSTNFCRLNAYLATCRGTDGTCSGATFTDIYRLYLFDQELRNLVLPVLENIEIAFRTHIAYLIAHKYGALGYRNCHNFKDKKYCKCMLQDIKKEIHRSDELSTTCHESCYGEPFPVWVVVELMSFGVLSKMYANLLDGDKDRIANEYYNTKANFVESWLHSLSTLRNICAHYGRLYDRRLRITPKLFKADAKKGIRNDTVFADLIIAGKLSRAENRWGHFVTRLAALVENYEMVKLEYLGFPEDWESILRQPQYRPCL